MELGCDVITEKPMTTDAAKCQRILNTQKATGRKVTVTFNYRYAPPRTQVKDLLMSGAIGDVKAVDFNYRLSVSHGADYFRRWHRDKRNSGSLLVHKSTHHFDLVNWWISDVPQQVWAQAKRDFYTPAMARRYGMTDFGPRCHDCADHEKCPWYLDLADREGLRKLYLENEQHDGYFRDRCIFLPENGESFQPGVDIDDYMSVSVRYRGGAMLTYSLVTYYPHEGYTIVFHGTKGRLVHVESESSYINGDGTVPGELIEGGTYIEVDEHHSSKPAWRPELWKGKGGHGGADPVMLSYIFGQADPADDKYMRASDHRAGAYSILTGVAASRSILSGEAVRIDDLVNGLETPPAPAMPSADEPLPYEPGESA
jgi:predicted dehydrogenase